ncbi:MAG: AGE family epimerase/isomerase [Victivallaceae bacterium]|nr:AGE family epimerase/isomerase [Victivallaceae bacterium]
MADFWGEEIEKYRRELENSVIPFWASHCLDREVGGFFTCLDRDGSVYDKTKYLWMQWRIVYLFAELYRSEYGEDKQSYLTIARDGFDFLTTHGRAPDGSYYFSLNGRGEPATAPFSIFSNCFAAMGAAALYRATGEKRYRDEAESAMRIYIDLIPNPKRQWEKALPGKTKYLSFGSYMILANLGCVMADCLQTDRYEKESREAIDFVMDKFWKPQYGAIFENILPDGSVDLESSEGRHLNPGHGLESMWFVMNYAEKHNDRALIERAAECTEALLKLGSDPEYGGIYYFMDVLGKPHMELQYDMKLWWPHCEAILASLYAYRLTGRVQFKEWFEKLDRWSFQHFADPEYGEWFGYLNRRGEVTHTLKGGKWKTMFHLPRMLLVALEQMKQIREMELGK